MGTNQLLSAVDAEISRFRQVRALLAGRGGTRGALSGRRKRTMSGDVPRTDRSRTGKALGDAEGEGRLIL
jgi:hypothetical protein